MPRKRYWGKKKKGNTSTQTQEEEVDAVDVAAQSQLQPDSGDEPQSNSKMELVLQCTRPNTYESAKFEVLDVDSGQGHCYHILESEKKIHAVKDETVDGGVNYILDYFSYDFTLRDWLRKNTTINSKGEQVRIKRYCTAYQGWGVNRPDDDVRKMIIGILHALIEMHEKDRFHGALSNPENYLIKLPGVTGGRYDGVQVKFQYTNLNSLHGQPTTVELGKRNDIWDVSTMIFTNILPGELKDFPKDIRHLINLMNNNNQCLISIVNHPALWIWNDRCDFFDKLWRLKHGFNYRGSGFAHDAIMGVTYPGKDWRLLIPEGTPLHKIYMENSYGSSRLELIRFVRNAYEHLTEEEGKGKNKVRKYTKDAPEWENMKYIEHRMTVLFPNLLCELYFDLANEGYYL